MERPHFPKLRDLLRPPGTAVSMSETFQRLSRLPSTPPPTKDETTGVFYSASLFEAAERLGKPVSKVTAVDLLSETLNNFPPGPTSELGGRVPSHHRDRPPAEKQRLASIGKAAVDEYAARSADANAR
jgi:hypothetical protein